MWRCGRPVVRGLALHQPVLHNAEHGFADHLCVAALWCAPTRERELTPLLIPAGELQQRGVHLAMPLPLLPQPEPIPRDGVGAGVGLQRGGIAEDGGSHRAVCAPQPHTRLCGPAVVLRPARRAACL